MRVAVRPGGTTLESTEMGARDRGRVYGVGTARISRRRLRFSALVRCHGLISLRSLTATPDAGIIALVLLLAMLWGGNSVAIKIGLEDFPPLMLAGLRFIIGIAAVTGWALFQRVRDQDGTRANSSRSYTYRSSSLSRSSPSTSARTTPPHPVPSCSIARTRSSPLSWPTLWSGATG